MAKTLKGIAALAGGIAGMYVRMPITIQLLVLLMVLDYISGIGAAIVGKSPKTPTGTLNSKTGFIGLARKAMILIIVLLASILDMIIDSAACTGAVTLFYTANEALSILENAVLLGVPVPARLIQVLDVAKQSREDTSGSL